MKFTRTQFDILHTDLPRQFRLQPAEQDSYRPAWTVIWQTPAFKVPGELDGFYLVGSPTSQILAHVTEAHMTLSNDGVLTASLAFNDNRPEIVLWESPLPPILGVEISSTTTTLPRPPQYSYHAPSYAPVQSFAPAPSLAFTQGFAPAQSFEPVNYVGRY